MKEYYIVLFYLSLTQLIYSQSNWKIGTNISPSISIPQTNLSIPSPKERFTYSFGVDALYNFSKNVFIKSGVNYFQRSLLVAKDISDTRFAYDPITGRIDYNKIGKVEISEIYQSISLPIILNYKFAEEDITSFIISGGVELGYLFNLKTIANSTVGGESSENESRKEFIASINLGLGLYQPISENILLIIIPKYSYDFYPSKESNSLGFQTIILGVELYVPLK